MNNQQFWKIIQATRNQAGGDDDQQHALLIQKLTELEPAEIAAFGQLYHDKMVELYRYDIWAAILLLNGGLCSDDSFSDFCDYLIAQGERLYNSVLQNPEALLNEPLNSEAEWEYEEMHFGAAADRAYAQAKGFDGDEDDFIILSLEGGNEEYEIPINYHWPKDPAGEPIWDDPEKLREKIPRIYEHVDYDNWESDEDVRKYINYKDREAWLEHIRKSLDGDDGE